MNKITQKMVKEVKLHDKKNLHNDAWWSVENLKSTTAIHEAMFSCGHGATIKEIAKKANG